MRFVEFVRRQSVLALFSFPPLSWRKVKMHFWKTKSVWAHSMTESCHRSSLWSRSSPSTGSCPAGRTSPAWLLAELSHFKILVVGKFMGHANKTTVAYGLCATSERGSTADISWQKGSQDNNLTCVWLNSRCMTSTRVSAPKSKCRWGRDAVLFHLQDGLCYPILFYYRTIS